MATPTQILKSAIKPAKEKEDESPKEEAGESPINELVERVFTTRNLVHFAHWSTGSYASHSALGELYDAIVSATDDVVENFQGEFGLLSGLETDCAKLDKDIIEYILEDAQWLRDNQDKIAKGSKAISSLLDILVAAYNRCLYKLKNLK
jgi:hypothetical protein